MSLKFSIIIVAYRDYDSLNRCIQFVRKREQEDYEIIVWDNTPFEIEHDIPVGCSYIKSESNIGFASGCNAGAKHAHSEILVFLHPDTEPNGDWLDRMDLGFDNGFDAIGPTSDYVAGMQQSVRYFDDPREFVETNLLIGFCLMIKAEMFKNIGGMDERCFLGCDDLDLSWRMTAAGLRLGICADVFVHHIGHTSMVLNSEKDRLIKDSETYLRSKLKAFYGENVPTSEELWGCKILATEIMRQTLSLCMIVKDHVANAQDIISQLANICDHVVVVATNPDFEYKLLAGGHFEKSSHCKFGFYEAKWEDDFASARNLALSKCTGDYVLWLDADDEMDADQMEIIKALLTKPGNHVCLQDCHFGFQVQNVDKEGNVTDTFVQSRLFPRIEGVKWGGLSGCHGYVHETIWESAYAANLQFVPTNITIRHTGYSDPEVMKDKQKRNLRLLLKEPQNCFTLYNIGQSYASIGDYSQAHNYYKDALDKSEGEPQQFIDHVRYVIAVCLYKMGLVNEAISYLEKNGKPDALFFLGSCLIDSNQNEKGCDLLWAYLKMGKINDPMGTNYPTFRPQAIKVLTEVGVLAP